MSRFPISARPWHKPLQMNATNKLRQQFAERALVSGVGGLIAISAHCAGRR
jgi:hypothetical protein